MANDRCPLPPGSRVWSYLRVSGDEQADRGLPIAGQRQAHETYAQQHGLVISQWFVDEAKPGGSTTGRDAFNDMIYLARREPRQADGILLWDLKRFARNLLDSQFYKADLRRRGWTLIFLSDDIPETDFGPVYEALLEWKAQKDRDDIAKDVKRGLHALAQMGYAPGGFPPRGYKAESLDVEIEGKKRQVRRWVPDPEWWDLARRAWEMRAAGSSLSEIQQATHIYRSRNCLTTFFANKTYLGIRKCGDTEVEGAHEPLITREIWDAVQRVSNRRSPSGRWLRHPRRVGSPFLLSGLLYCQLCGASMNGGRTPARKLKDGNRAEWRFYMCARKKREYLQACPSRRLKAELVEDAVLHTVLSTVLTPQHLLQLLEETNEALNDRHHDLTQREDQLQYQLERQDERMSRLLDALELGESAAVRDRLQQREAERALLAAQLAEVQQLRQRARIELSPTVLQQLVDDMRRVIQSSAVQKARRMLRTLVVRVEATKRGGVLYYTFPFPAQPDRPMQSPGPGALAQFKPASVEAGLFPSVVCSPPESDGCRPVQSGLPMTHAEEAP